jgi:heat shock protein HslJ
MARFTHASTSHQSTLVAYDNFASEPIDNWRAVPIAVTRQGTTTQWFIARLQQEGESWQHVDSVFLGEDLRMSSMTVNGDTVEVEYLVHDRTQARTEVPRVTTTAIIELPTAVVVQAGRTPKTEAVVEYKRFSGEYQWQSTTGANGVVVTPDTASAFTLRFDANRLSLTTDCNSGSAEFTTEPLPATAFSVGSIASTKMFCESAQEAIYFAMIQQIVSYEETDEGLTFTLADESEMVFVPKVEELPFATTQADAATTESQ